MQEERQLLLGRKDARACLGRVLILGLGKTGQAVLSYLASESSRVESITVAAEARSDAAEAFLSSLDCSCPVEALFGCESVSGSYDLCVASPGIPEWSALYRSARAASRELIGEVEFAWRESERSSTWIAITGTNGKTTVTSLCAHILRTAGRNARAVGNIGDACLAAVLRAREEGTDVFVAETSSYQLASTVRFAPEVAVLLNITPDHLHWHGTMEAYRDAKFKLIDGISGNPDACVVLDAVNPVVRQKARELRQLQAEGCAAAFIPIGSADGLRSDMRKRCGSQNAAFLDADGVLRVAWQGVEHALCHCDELQIKGDHNISNALAAASAALAAGCSAEAVVEGLKSFAPLEHRMEPCGTVKGISCINDSKGTNVDATLKALGAYEGQGIGVLLGGEDKGTPLDELVSQTLKSARFAVLYGESLPRFEEAFKQAGCVFQDGTVLSDSVSFTYLRAAGMKEALDVALSMEPAPSVLLLSPACASFDEFSSFEERGRVFKELVAAKRRDLGA